MPVSIVDDLMARGGLDPDFVGISRATAGPLEWNRERGESEARFLGRARAEAHAAGYRTLNVRGAIETTAAVIPIRPEPGGNPAA
jgi:hypothetical protein